MNNPDIEEKISGIDTFKLVAAILVLMSHTGFLLTRDQDINYYFINTIFRWCVPFFFMCTGFFLHQDNWRSIVKYVLRILLLYSIWTVLYIPLQHIPSNSKEILGFIYNFFFNGSTIPFWYFPALIFSTLLSVALFRISRGIWPLIIAFLLFILGALGDSYGNIGYLGNNAFVHAYKTVFEFTRNGFLYGTLYVVLGIYMKEYITRINNALNYVFCRPFLIFAIFVLLLTFQFLELFLIKTQKWQIDRNILFASIPLTLYIFVISNHIQVKKKVSLLLRKTSIIIFCIHYMMMHLYNEFFIDIAPFRFIFTLFSSSCLALLIIWLSEQKGLKFLKNLY